MPVPTEPMPRLAVPTVDGAGFDTARDMGENGALVVVYRGRHCPLCRDQLAEIDRLAPDVQKMGVALIAVSGDGHVTARDTASDVGLKHLTLGHDLTMTMARDWGLWVSSAREGSDEPDLFAEPGIFHLRQDGTLYAAWIQSAPFARPAFADVLGALRMRLDKDYPPRGTYRGPLAEHDADPMIEAPDGPGAEIYGT